MWTLLKITKLRVKVTYLGIIHQLEFINKSRYVDHDFTNFVNPLLMSVRMSVGWSVFYKSK